MKKLLVIIAAAASALSLTVAPALADNTTGSCPSDVHSILANANLDVQLGGTSTATFTIPAGCTAKVSLVSYTAAAPVFTWENSVFEAVYDRQTQNLGSGAHAIRVKTPNCFYQLDLVLGEVIEHLGPADSGNFYTPQGRLAASSNGGNSACGAATVATPPVDVCSNIAGAQAKVPKGDVAKSGECFKAPVKGKKHKKHKPHNLPYTP